MHRTSTVARFVSACFLVASAAVTSTALNEAGSCRDAVAHPAPRDAVFPSEVVVRHPAASTVLVFVHGLGGDGMSTWTAPNGTYWPTLIRDDPRLSRFDVYVYQYATRMLGECMPITDVANDLRLRLDDDGIFQRYRNVVFVAHSMGGLVVRQFLLRNRERVAAEVPAIVLYATPSAGSSKADIARIVSRCSQVDDLRTLDSNTYLQSQQSDWMSSGLSKTIETYCAFETLSSGLGKTVTRSSATLMCSTDAEALPTNHSEAVKPPCLTSKPHVFLRNVLSRLKLHEEPAGRPPVQPPSDSGPRDEKTTPLFLEKLAAVETPASPDGWQTDTPFPVLPDFRAFPTKPKSVAARTSLNQARLYLEQKDLSCGVRAGEELIRGTGSSAFDALWSVDSSMREEKTPWALVYRAVALVRFNAFESADEDLREASSLFENAGEPELATIVARVRETIGSRKRDPPVGDELRASGSGCAVDTAPTVCALRARIERVLLSDEDGPLVARRVAEILRARRSADVAVPVRGIEISCAREVAGSLSDADAIPALKLLLAVISDDDSEAPLVSSSLYLRLRVTGKYAEAAELYARYGARWERTARLDAALTEAFDPRVQNDFERSPALRALVPAEQRLMMDIHRAAARVHAEIRSVAASVQSTAGDSSRPVDLCVLFAAAGAKATDLKAVLTDVTGSLAALGHETGAPFAAIQTGRLAGEASELTARALSRSQYRCAREGADGFGALLSLLAFDFSIVTGNQPVFLLTNPEVLDWALFRQYAPEFRSSMRTVLRDVRTDSQMELFFHAAPVEDSEIGKLMKSFREAMACRALPAKDAQSDCLANALWSALNEARTTPIFAPISTAHERAKKDAAMLAEPRSMTRSFREVYLPIFARELDGELATDAYSDAQRWFGIAALVGARYTVNPRDVDLARMTEMNWDRAELAGDVPVIARIVGVVSSEPTNGFGTMAVRNVPALRRLVGTLRTPAFRLAAAAIPGFFHGLSASETEAAMTLLGIRASGRFEVNHLPLALALAFHVGGEGPAAALTFDQVRAIVARMPDRTAPADLHAIFPVGKPLGEAFLKAEPAAAVPKECEKFDVAVGFSASSDTFSFVVTVGCVDIPFLKAAALGMAAAEEQRWPEVRSAIDQMQGSQSLVSSKRKFFVAVLGASTKLPEDIRASLFELLARASAEGPPDLTLLTSTRAALRTAQTTRETEIAAALVRAVSENFDRGFFGDADDWVSFFEDAAAVRHDARTAAECWELRKVRRSFVRRVAENDAPAKEFAAGLAKQAETATAMGLMGEILLARRDRTPPDVDSAMSFLARAAEGGDSAAMVELAMRLRTRGDERGARAWLKRAAAKGDPLAIVRTASHESPTKPTVEALLRLASEGMPEAMYELALVSLTYNARSDVDAAMYWLERAARAGFAPAFDTLAQLRGGR